MSNGQYPSMGELLRQPIEDVCFQVALWTFAQGRERFREAHDTAQRGQDK